MYELWTTFINLCTGLHRRVLKTFQVSHKRADRPASYFPWPAQHLMFNPHHRLTCYVRLQIYHNNKRASLKLCVFFTNMEWNRQTRTTRPIICEFLFRSALNPSRLDALNQSQKLLSTNPNSISHSFLLFCAENTPWFMRPGPDQKRCGPIIFSISIWLWFQYRLQ